MRGNTLAARPESCRDPSFLRDIPGLGWLRSKGVLPFCFVRSLGCRSEASGGPRVRSWSSGAGDKQEHLIESLYEWCLQKGKGRWSGGAGLAGAGGGAWGAAAQGGSQPLEGRAENTAFPSRPWTGIELPQPAMRRGQRRYPPRGGGRGREGEMQEGRREGSSRRVCLILST